MTSNKLRRNAEEVKDKARVLACSSFDMHCAVPPPARLGLLRVPAAGLTVRALLIAAAAGLLPPVNTVRIGVVTDEMAALTGVMTDETAERTAVLTDEMAVLT